MPIGVGILPFLTSEERGLYDYCMDIANDAYLVSNTDLEREKYIHDFICDRVVYKTDGTKDGTMPVPRHKTAIGAFFDGEANCQGYTDLFYVLATMAGFEVRKQIGGDWNWAEQSDNNHIWNVIKLDGRWYQVDVTWDDQEHSDAPYIYANFNFAPGWSYGHGLGNFGVCADMGWSSDQKYFYYSELGGMCFGLCRRWRRRYMTINAIIQMNHGTCHVYWGDSWIQLLLTMR